MFRITKNVSSPTIYLFSGNFTCGKCGKVYAHRASLYNHSFSCGKVAAFRCPYCSKCYTRKHGLQLHMKLTCKLAPVPINL